MVSVRKLFDETILTGSYNCKDFTGIKVNVNGVDSYIRHPFTVERKGGVYLVTSAFNERVEIPIGEYAKADLERIDKELDNHTASTPAISDSEIIAMGFRKPLFDIINAGSTNGEISVSYATALLVKEAPKLTVIIGADGQEFSSAMRNISSYSKTGFTMYSWDSDGAPYQGNGKVQYSF